LRIGEVTLAAARGMPREPKGFGFTVKFANGAAGDRARRIAEPRVMLRAMQGNHALLYALGTTYNLDARSSLCVTVADVNDSSNGTFSVLAMPCDPGAPTSPSSTNRIPVCTPQ
jgi:hypothetical protein